MFSIVPVEAVPPHVEVMADGKPPFYDLHPIVIFFVPTVGIEFSNGVK
jgi:hypothetical protein